jgi:hypothetical protein
MEFLSSSTQSIQTAKPWHTPSQANSIYKTVWDKRVKPKTGKEKQEIHTHISIKRISKLHSENT